MKILVSRTEQIVCWDGSTGSRIVQIVEDNATFPTHSDLTWHDALPEMNEFNLQDYYYCNDAITLIPVEEEEA